MAQKKNLGSGLPPIKNSYVDPAPTNEEVDSLIAVWNANVPPEYRGMLEAPSLTMLASTDSKYTGRWVWDDQNKAYIDRKTGSTVTTQKLHQIFSGFIRSYTSRRGSNA